MSNNDIANEYFDIESILRDMVPAEISVSASDDYRNTSIHVMMETTADVTVISRELNLLARDKNANTGIGIRPQTVLGNIDVINRLSDISSHTLLTFYAEGWGIHGLKEAIAKIAANPLFGFALPYVKTVLLCYRSAEDPESLEVKTDKLYWDVPDFIQYHINESAEPLESACSVILGLYDIDEYTN